MSSYRVSRANEDILRELSVILRELKDPRVSEAMLSIVKLDLSRDMSSCKVFISSMKGMETAREAARALKGASGFIRHELGSRLDLRHTPELRFIADDSIERSADISRLLGGLEGGPHAD